MSNDVNELFSRDPMDLTESCIDSIIAEMRARRHLFETPQAKPAAKKKLTEQQQKAISLDLGDIDL